MLKKFHDHPIGPSLMGRVYNYDILSVSYYSRAFNYIPTWEKARLTYIATPNVDKNFNHISDKEIDKKTERLYEHESAEEILLARCQSDYVRWVLETAYMTPEQANRLKMTTKGLAEEVRNNKEKGK